MKLLIESFFQVFLLIYSPFTPSRPPNKQTEEEEGGVMNPFKTQAPQDYPEYDEDMNGQYAYEEFPAPQKFPGRPYYNANERFAPYRAPQATQPQPIKISSMKEAAENFLNLKSKEVFHMEQIAQCLPKLATKHDLHKLLNMIKKENERLFN